MGKVIKLLKITILFFFIMLTIQLVGYFINNFLVQEITMLFLHFLVLMYTLKLIYFNYKITCFSLLHNLFNIIRNTFSSFTVLCLKVFSIFTVIYYFFDFIDFLNVDFNYSSWKLSLVYFILTPLNLIFKTSLEELVFRKLFFGILKNTKALYKMLISSFFFSIIHLPNNINLFLYLFIGSMLYSYIYFRYKHVFVSIAIHFTINFSLIFYGIHEMSMYNEIVSYTNKLEDINSFIGINFLIVYITLFIIFISALTDKNYKEKNYDGT